MTEEKMLFRDPAAPIDKRVDDLVSRLTLEEKASQMVNGAPAIERLGIPAYNWWNECLHGVARAGTATVFPQAIGLAATWNTGLMFEIAEVISDEARAKHHAALKLGDHGIYKGLTFWSPNINIFRDPRWGRGQETYGEDPLLTARMAVAFITGLQGDDPDFPKVVATPKHFAVHSGPEHDRHHFDVDVSDRDLHETYLPAFKASIVEAKAMSVMGAYNRFRGESCSASKLLLTDILREEWGFDGYVVSDCGAIKDIYLNHKIVETPAEAAALAVNNGCDLECGQDGAYLSLPEAVEQGLIDEETIDQALKRLFKARFLLGMFDPPAMVPYANIAPEIVDSQAHREMALQAARESIVLLKNSSDFLPFDENIKSIAVIGPNAHDAEVLRANYSGTPSNPVTPFQGIMERGGSEMLVDYAKGCDLLGDSTEDFEAAVNLARESDVAVLVLGLSQVIEGEEGQREGVAGDQRSQGDRSSLALPGMQEALLQAVHETGTPVVVVLLNGSAVAVNWAHKYAHAVLEAWYPGQAGGVAVAEVLFGDYNPAGRLPVTFYKSADDLPEFSDYDMAGRTYRYFEGDVLYPFGYGLSYTHFTYADLQLPEQLEAGEPVEVRVTVTNDGDRAGDEVVQLYLTDVEASAPVSVRQLVGFERIHLAPGESEMVVFEVKPEQMSLITDDGRRIVEPGVFEIVAGGGQPIGVSAGQGTGGGGDEENDGVEDEVVEDEEDEEGEVEVGEEEGVEVEESAEAEKEAPEPVEEEETILTVSFVTGSFEVTGDAVELEL